VTDWLAVARDCVGDVDTVMVAVDDPVPGDREGENVAAEAVAVAVADTEPVRVAGGLYVPEMVCDELGE